MKEVTDFGFNLKEGNIDGFVTCDCGEEIHFIIKGEKIKELVKVFNKAKEVKV